MIVLVSGTPDVESLTDAERMIYREKDRSRRTYTYDSWNSLLFELQVRAAIMEAAAAMNSSEVSFSSFKQSRCNERFWERKENGAFLQRNDVRSSAAIRDIFENGSLYAFECATAIIILLYKAVLDIIGDEKFDRLFNHLYLYSWNYDHDLRLITLEHGAEAFGGDIQYFKNPDVNPEWIEWQGENVIKMGAGLYYGHGIGIRTGREIIEKLNRVRIPGSTVSAYLMDEVTFPDFAYLQKIVMGNNPVNPSASSLSTIPTVFGQVVATIGGRSFVKKMQA
ncbi:protein-glutamine gamma-glutamyltransferase [Paenibacillus sp. OAS669]|uniref:protein-glutamine gamma-glutamyltransferase n=1 Tax=Paenibacillus sp. OAS669 TaxID=2663821 RepID=UPI00178B941D|nr:protein-glutamine gamma-glutamyltransferase [Paenibacillus sp. OAS669]MBE1444070.1 protein-glutamine gamma-glutamyltransferase [Paenibacillus sp. OAS669]